MGEPLTDEGGEETGVPGENPWRRASENEVPTLKSLVRLDGNRGVGGGGCGSPISFTHSRRLTTRLSRRSTLLKIYRMKQQNHNLGNTSTNGLHNLKAQTAVSRRQTHTRLLLFSPSPPLLHSGLVLVRSVSNAVKSENPMVVVMHGGRCVDNK